MTSIYRETLRTGELPTTPDLELLPPVQLNNLVGLFRENRLFKQGGWIAANHSVCFQ